MPRSPRRVRPEVISGSIDTLLRPVVHIELLGLSEPMETLVDTGFTGDLIIYESDARSAQLSFSPTVRQRVIVAGDQEALFVVTRGSVRWCGVEREIDIFVIPGLRLADRGLYSTLGTKFLSECLLTVNFAKHRVEIRHLEPSRR